METTPADRTTAEPRGAEDVRRDLVLAGIAAFREAPFHLVSLDEVAFRTGTPLEQVREHFPVFDDLVFAVTRTWYAERMAPLLAVGERQGAVALLRAIIESNIADPALMRFLAALVNVAAFSDHPLGPLLQTQWLHFYALVQRTLADDLVRGREVATIDPATAAEQLIAVYEGLQLQAMVRPAMNLLGAFDRTIAGLRDDWALTTAAPVWEV